MARWSLLLRTLLTVVMAATVSFGMVSVFAPSHHVYRQVRVGGCHSGLNSGLNKAQHTGRHPRSHRLVSPNVDSIAFGTESFNDDGYLFVPTTDIANKAGTPFGWRMHISGAQAGDKVRLKEVLVLPQTPKIWGLSAYTHLSNDRTTATTVKTIDAAEGWVENIWEVSPGDPSGKYEVRVYLNDKLIKTAHFDVK